MLNATGYLRFRHWRLYGERGLAGKQAAVWINGEILTIEHATESLAQYGITLEADGRRLRDVGEPRLYVTGHRSLQPFLPMFEAVAWRPAQRLASYRERRRRQIKDQQASLLAPETEITATG